MNQTEYVYVRTIGGERIRMVAHEPGICRHNELAQVEQWNDLPMEVECKGCGRRFSLEAAKMMIEMRSHYE